MKISGVKETRVVLFEGYIGGRLRIGKCFHRIISKYLCRHSQQQSFEAMEEEKEENSIFDY